MTFAFVKRFIALILLITFSLQSFYSASVTAWFFVNRASIAKEKCVNKEKPQLHCNGKCYLSKKLKETEEKKDENSSQQLKQWVETGPCIISSINFILQYDNENGISYSELTDAYSFFHFAEVFHPPSVLLS